MNFKEAYEALKQGACIKRAHWLGYWQWNPAMKTIDVVTKNGHVVPLQYMEDVGYILDIFCQDDWEVCDPVYATDLNVQTFTFGEAIRKLKQGKRVARKGWNGKGMYLWLMPTATVKAEWCEEPHMHQLAEQNGGEIEALGCIRMLTADKKILTGWLASQTDMLSEDWIEVK